MRHRRILYLLVIVLLTEPLVAAVGLPLKGSEAEHFLSEANIIDRRPVGSGITRPERVTLEMEELEARAVWKTVDVRKPIMRFADGTREVGFVDSYKNEVASYELDKLIGLGMVPPTVERRVRGDRGALQLWVEGSLTETERNARGMKARDVEAWNRQMLKVRLFHNLTYNTDFNNTGNILCDFTERIYLIDHSRAFRNHAKLLVEEDLTRFSSSLLDGLRRLDQEILKEEVGQWLSKQQIVGLLARRDLILALAERRIAESGEEEVLYP